MQEPKLNASIIHSPDCLTSGHLDPGYDMPCK